ncbi:MAG TPA: glycosyltransferase family 39 protein, partial [Chloroflexota bacterium]|nr:glycosyltransferase family 39 protein [Chloroflexota bacterium]
MQPVFVLAIAASVVLALLAQSALLRTRQAMPCVPLFLSACVIGGLVAFKLTPPPLAFGRFKPAERAFGWEIVLALGTAANAACLVFFARNLRLTEAWLLFAASVVAIAVAFWLLDGRPGLRADWRAEAPWLVGLGVLTVVGTVLRLIWLGNVPAGLWFDEAFSGLQVQRILADGSFRPVYVSGLAQEPSMLWYFMAASFKLLGPTLLALRLPTAIGGVVGIIAVFLLGRELFSRRVGLIAAGLLSTLVWQLTFSRLAFNSVWSVSVDALGLFFLVRAARKGSWTAAALAGVSLGLGLHLYYTSRLMILVAGFALITLWLARAKPHFHAIWRVVLAAIVAGLITGSPIGEFALLHPAEFNNRLDQASIFREVQASHSYAPIISNIKAHFLMFNYA